MPGIDDYLQTKRYSVIKDDPVQAPHAYKPGVVFQRVSYEKSAWSDRPILWYASQDHLPAYGNATTTTYTTAGANILTGIDYTIDSSWRGARGRCTFRVLGTDIAWMQNAQVAITAGWDDTAHEAMRATRWATAYIESGGIERLRDGSQYQGQLQIAVSVAGFDVVRMPQKEIVDARQAGGRIVQDWLADVARRLNVPWTIYEDPNEPAIATRRIPLAPLPSAPHLEAQDGQWWNDHLTSVCDSLGLRWGFDRSGYGELFVDNGPPTYSGTYSFVVDADTLSPEGQWYTVTHNNSIDGMTNICKAVAGGQHAYYQDTVAARTAFGDDWTRVVSVADGANPYDVLVQTWLESHDNATQIVWRGPLRVDLRPDEFLLMADPPQHMGIPVGSVWRITRHHISCEPSRGTALSEIEAVMVSESGT